MKYLDEYRDPEVAKALLGRIHGFADRISRDGGGPVKIMEICGSHTVAIFRAGIKTLLPENISLISGPGCPVCVTDMADVDRMIAITEITGNGDPIVATFGDMLRVPGSFSSLERQKARGADVRVASTPLDALDWAYRNPARPVFFLGIGFETTSPAIAATVLRARALELDNFFVFPAFKLLPPALTALLESPDAAIDGFLCPGHVSVILGADAYREVALKYRKPCVIAGFEPIDILYALSIICEQLANNEHEVKNAYSRAVTNGGNRKAMGTLKEVFEPADASWRGLGNISASGLAFKDGFTDYDALKKFRLEHIPVGSEPEGCACGQVLRGIADPAQCPLFGRKCTPDNPVGSCMVSSEGSCAAWFKYSA